MTVNKTIPILTAVFGILICGAVSAAETPVASAADGQDPSKVEAEIRESDFQVREEFLRKKEARLTDMQAQLKETIDNFEREKAAWQKDQDEIVAAQVDALYESKRNELENERQDLEAMKAQAQGQPAAVQMRANDQDGELNELRSSLAALESQQDGWRNEMKRLAEQVKSKSESNRLLEERVASLQADLNLAKAEAKAAALQVPSEDQKKEWLSMEVASLENERKKVESERAQLESDRKNFEARQREQEELLAAKRQDVENQRRELEDERLEFMRQKNAGAAEQPASGIADFEIEKRDLENAREQFAQERAAWEAQKQAPAPPAPSPRAVEPAIQENAGPSLDARILDLERKKDVIRKLVEQKIDDLNSEKEQLAQDREAFEKEREAFLSGKPQT